MFEPWIERVRSEVSGAGALESVRALARFHRVQASPGYDQAAEWLADRLDGSGLAVEIESVPGDGRSRRLGWLMPEGWECTRAVAAVVGSGERDPVCDYQVEKLSLVLRSAAARGRSRLVLVEDGSETEHYRDLDVRGAVVLTDGPVQRVHDLAVVRRGALGLLYDGRRLLPPVRGRFDDPDARTYTSFWWNGDEPRGFGFVLSAHQGERLRRQLRDGATLELEFEIAARAFPTHMPLVSAVLPGEGAGEVLILAHLCHPQPSANDNASGAAAALESARVLAALRERGELDARAASVRFLWMPELTGTYAWLAGDPARAGRLAAALNLDMVGESQERCGSTLLVEHPPCFAASFAEELLVRVRHRALEWVTSYSGPGHYSMTRTAEVPYSGGSDHVVLNDPAVGVPCPMLIQWPDRYYHSSHDTPDKTDPDSLALAVRCAASYAGFLASAGGAQRDWLLAAVGRGARSRTLSAADHGDDTPRRLARERLRGLAALESLARLGVDRERIASARAGFEEFLRREAPAALAAPSPAAATPGGPSPRLRRAVAAPLHGQRHLLPGFPTVPEAERDRWHRLDREPDAATLTELAWVACDGRRTVDEIARLVWLETGHYRPEAIAEFFAAASNLGLCARPDATEETCSPDAPGTASR